MPRGKLLFWATATFACLYCYAVFVSLLQQCNLNKYSSWGSSYSHSVIVWHFPSLYCPDSILNQILVKSISMYPFYPLLRLQDNCRYLNSYFILYLLVTESRTLRLFPKTDKLLCVQSLSSWPAIALIKITYFDSRSSFQLRPLVLRKVVKSSHDPWIVW